MARPKFKAPQFPDKPYVPWIEKYAPTDISELALHPSKLDQVRKSLSSTSPTCVLILSGPPGSAKSTCAKLIAKEQNKRVIEYIDPESFVGVTSLSRGFEEFMFGASMYDRDQAIIVVEDLPNVFHGDTAVLFENCLINWVLESRNRNSRLPIVVVCFTEIEVNARFNDALVVSRVLNTLVEMKPFVDWIKVNPVNSQIIKKTLNSIAKAENIKIPPQQLKRISECGDIRSAINAFEIAVRTADLKLNCDLWIRDDKVELFHAVGKLVYGSKDPGSVNRHISNFEDTIDTFNLTLLENYTSAKHQQLPLKAAAECADWLSLSDISVKYNNNTGIGLVAALGVGSAIEHSDRDEHQPKQFAPMKFIQHFKWQKEYYNSRYQHHNDQSFRDTLDEKAYLQFLKKKNQQFLLDSDDSDDEFDML